MSTLSDSDFCRRLHPGWVSSRTRSSPHTAPVHLSDLLEPDLSERLKAQALPLARDDDSPCAVPAAAETRHMRSTLCFRNSSALLRWRWPLASPLLPRRPGQATTHSNP